MKNRQDIFFSEGRLCIRLSDNVTAMRGYEPPSQKQSAMLYRDGQMHEIHWQAVQAVDDSLCLVFMPTDLITELPAPSAELSTELKSRSIRLISNLADALDEAGDSIAWSFGSIPLSSFWFLPDDSVLLMSAQIADIIDRFSLDKERFLDRERWYAHNCVNDFGKANFLFQLVYYAFTGVAPFQETFIREAGFRPVPMKLFFSPSNAAIQEICRQVDKGLSGNKKIMFQTKDPIEYFRQAFSSAKDLTVDDITPSDNPQMEAYRKKRISGANRTVFIRKKGLLTAIIAIAVAAVIGIAAYYIREAVRPPETKDLDDIQIIEYYLNALTDIDVTAIQEPLKNGYEGPDFMEVTSYHVNRAMQQAYTNTRAIIDVRTWMAEGKPALDQDAFIYGVSDVLSIERLSDDVVRVRYIMYTPSDVFEMDPSDLDSVTEIRSAAIVYVYEVTRDFTFQTKKTWREITEISNVDVVFIEKIEVPYVGK